MSGPAPRLILEPGSHALLNLGDIAMLETCVERLLARWPDARLDVVTSAPEALARYCPRAVALSTEGRYRWQERWTRLRERWAPISGWPPASRLAVELLRRTDAVAGSFLSALAAADAFVLTGRGGTTDAFLEDSLIVLDLLEVAAHVGVPTFMMSQGVGPISDTALRDRARAVLPTVRVIAVREERAAVPLLDSLGVDPGRVVTTGDDAVERAYLLRPAGRPETGIGVALRVAPYSALDTTTATALMAVLSRVADRRRSPLIPLPISLYPHEADAAAMQAGLGADVIATSAAVETPTAVIERAARCRVVVAGSYHAAVFAMSQGTPTVCLAGTPYYEDKFRGLVAQFGGGSVCLELEGFTPEGLEDAIEAAWTLPDESRAAMLAAAERQINAGREAYGRLYNAVERDLRARAFPHS